MPNEAVGRAGLLASTFARHYNARGGAAVEYPTRGWAVGAANRLDRFLILTAAGCRIQYISRAHSSGECKRMLVLYLAILVAIPVATICTSKSTLASFAISVVIGTLVLWSRMIYLEARAADADFEIVFYLGMMLWAALLAVAYAAIIGAATGAALLFGWRGQRRHRNREPSALS